MESRKTIVPPSNRPRTLPINHRPSPHKASSQIVTIHGHINSAHVELIDPVGVCFLPNSVNNFPGGTTFVPNRDLARRHKTTHMAYTRGLYEALRGGRHTIFGSGLAPEGRRGEIHEVRAEVETARAYVRMLLDLRLVDNETRVILTRAQQDLAKRLKTKRSVHKTIAHGHVLRGLEIVDVTQRANPSAAALVTGAGIQHLLDRQVDVSAINIRVSRRTVAIWNALERYLAPYDQLRAALFSDEPDGFPALLKAAKRGEDGVRRFMRRVDGFVGIFQSSRCWPLPFRKNAIHVLADLTAIQSYRKHGGVEFIQAMLTKLKHGITWVYVQKHLELEVLSPLSFTLAEMENIRRVRMRRHLSDPDACARGYGMWRLDYVTTALWDFHGRIGSCSDEGLDKKGIKAHVQVLVKAAIDAGTKGKWREAKRLLKKASALL